MRMENKDMYRIQYVDNNYQLVEWTEDQLDNVYRDMSSGEEVSLVDKCIFRLKDIRAITYLPPIVEEEETPEEEQTVVLTEMGTYDKEIFELMQQLGVDVGEIKGERGSKQ